MGCVRILGQQSHIQEEERREARGGAERENKQRQEEEQEHEEPEQRARAVARDEQRVASGNISPHQTRA